MPNLSGPAFTPHYLPDTIRGRLIEASQLSESSFQKYCNLLFPLVVKIRGLKDV